MRIRCLRPGAALAVTCALWAAGCSDSAGPESSAELAFLVPPASLTYADHMAPPVTVVVRDGRGNTVTTWWDTVSLTLEGGGSLGGTTSRAAWRGNAWFDDLRVASVGTGYRLVARAPGLPEATSEPFDVHAIFQASAVSAGQTHTCALTADGTAYCWGGNVRGQLGTGTGYRLTPTPVQTDVRFSSISTSGSGWSNCALSQVGEMYCWGWNERGMVGDGTTEDRRAPTLASLPGPALMVDTGWLHTCAVLEDRRAFCWGANWYGELGNGDSGGDSASPVQVQGEHEWARIAAGGSHTCGLTTTGEAYCWGRNRYGAIGLGHGDDENYLSPTPVVGGHRFTALFAGGGPYPPRTCGLTTEANLLCWPTWLPTQGRWAYEPTPYASDLGLVEVALWERGLCGITADRKLHCFGPTLRVPDLEAVSVSVGRPDQAGIVHACFVTPAGDTFCWGGNEHGRLGVGSVGETFSMPRGVWAPPGG